MDYLVFVLAGVAELVDARDLKSLGVLLCAGSNPASGTILTYTISGKEVVNFLRSRGIGRNSSAHPLDLDPVQEVPYSGFLFSRCPSFQYLAHVLQYPGIFVDQEKYLAGKAILL